MFITFLERVFLKILKIFKEISIIPDYISYRKKDTDRRFSLKLKDLYPQTQDKTIQTEFNSHYVYHTAWAARKLKQTNPTKHVDISSSLHFCTIVSAFTPVDFYDYRPAQLNLSNLKSMHADLASLPFKDESIKSLSCMHTIEHIGLGRYGDSIDPDGDLQAISELKRVLSKNGSLFFVVPLGQPKIQFNAHRIYSYEQIAEYFNGFALKEFSLITDNGNFVENARADLVKQQKYACGCFWFIKNDNN